MKEMSLCQGRCLSCPYARGSFLEELEAPEREAITKKLRGYSGKKNEVLFREGAPADSLWIIRQGSVKICTYDSEGREQIIAIFSEGETIWVSMFLNAKETTYPYSAICLTDVIVCQILRQDFESAIQDTHTALKIVGLLSNKLHDANERILILSASDPQAKIARLFLYRINHQGGTRVTMKLEDIAAHVSLRPETVSRKLGELCDEGILRKEGQSTFEILDFNELEDIAHR